MVRLRSGILSQGLIREAYFNLVALAQDKKVTLDVSFGVHIGVSFIIRLVLAQWRPFVVNLVIQLLINGSKVNLERS